MKYRVWFWSRSKLTGPLGKGLYMEKELAQAYVAEGRTKFPDLEYWLEEEEAGSTPTDPDGIGA